MTTTAALSVGPQGKVRKTFAPGQFCAAESTGVVAARKRSNRVRQGTKIC